MTNAPYNIPLVVVYYIQLERENLVFQEHSTCIVDRLKIIPKKDMASKGILLEEVIKEDHHAHL